MLALVLQAEGKGPDLKPWERLEGALYIGRKEVEFEAEAEARAYAGKAGGEVTRTASGWGVYSEMRVDLIKEIWRRRLEQGERLVDGILLVPSGRDFDTKKEAEDYSKTRQVKGPVYQTKTDNGVFWCVDYDNERNLLALARDKVRAEGMAARWFQVEVAGWQFKLLVPRAGFFVAHRAYKGTRLTGIFEGPNRREVGVTVFFPEEDLRHSFVGRSLLKRGSLEEIEGCKVFRTGEFGVVFQWELPGNRYFIIESPTEIPSEVIQAFVGRYPSVWGKDFKIDMLAWAKREAEISLQGMERSVKAEPPLNPPEQYLQDYNQEFANIAIWFEVGEGINLRSNRPEESRRRHLERFKAWWEQEKATIRLRKGAPLDIHEVYRRSTLLPKDW